MTSQAKRDGPGVEESTRPLAYASEVDGWASKIC